MGILDSLFAANNLPSSGTAPVPDASAPPAPTPNPTYADFYKQLLDAAAANGRANPTSLFNWLSGRNTDAKVEAAKAMAPAAWQQQQTGQVGMQNAQLGSARDFATTGALTGTNIDPANPMASIPAMTSAYSGAINGTPAAGPAPTASPSAAPMAPAPAAPIDPVAAQRAMFLRMGRFNMMQGNQAAAADFFKQANAGLPADTVTRPDGAVGDGITGNPITGNVGALLAARAGGVSGAQKNAELPAVLTSQSHQAGLDRTTTAMADADKAQYDTLPGYNTTNGAPALVSKLDYARGAHPNFAPGDNPFTAKHQTEIDASQKDAGDAHNTLVQLDQLAQAAHGLKTGAWGDNIQNIRRGMTQLGLTSPEFSAATSRGDVMNQIGLEVAALRAKAASGGRTALGTLNAFRSVKPGLLSTDPETSIQALRPAYQRQIDYGNFASKYYGSGENWNKLDAPSAFAAANPDRNYVEQSGLPPNPTDYGVSKEGNFLGWHQGKPVFSLNGKRVQGN